MEKFGGRRAGDVEGCLTEYALVVRRSHLLCGKLYEDFSLEWLETHLMFGKLPII